jgi:hypothetical protein
MLSILRHRANLGSDDSPCHLSPVASVQLNGAVGGPPALLSELDGGMIPFSAAGGPEGNPLT